MKNIIIICDYAYIEGGATKVAIQTAIALSNYTDYNIYFFAGCGEPCEELKNSNVNVICLKMYDLLGNPNRLNALKNGIYNRKSGEKLKNLINSFNGNSNNTLVHVHTYTKVLSSSIFKITQELNIPTFITIHDYFLTCPNGGCFNYVKNHVCEIPPMSLKCLLCNCDVRHYYHKIWRYIRQIKQNSIIRKNDNIGYIFISKFQEKQLLKRIPSIKNKYMLQNPIDLDNRIRVNAENNNYYIYIGRLSEEKGVRLFCESVSESNCNAVVIGDGKLFSELKNKYTNIIFTGWLQKANIKKWILKARCLIFTSLWYEGSPLTIPEVQAYGLPCIVTNTNAGTDTIKHGINGEIVTANKEDIIQSIKRMENNDYIKKLSQNTYELFDENRSNEYRYAKKLLEIYLSQYQ